MSRRLLRAVKNLRHYALPSLIKIYNIFDERRGRGEYVERRTRENDTPFILVYTGCYTAFQTAIECQETLLDNVGLI